MNIILTGAESTGKSTLAKKLAPIYGGVAVSEFARDYIENLKRDYNYNDVCVIANYQRRNEQQTRYSERLFFYDTGLIITKVWFEEKFGKQPDWLDAYLKRYQNQIFLLCDTDLVWQADSVRENGGQNREVLQKKYLYYLQNYQTRFQLISGHGEQRLLTAKYFINNELGYK